MPASLFQSTAVSDQLAERLRAMPKVEIHVHLEGATGPDTVWDMAQRNGVALPAASPSEWRSFYAFRDFAHFIRVYLLASSAMQTPRDYEQMVVDFGAHQARQHIRYSETYFSPQLHLGRALSSLQILRALKTGADRAEREHGTRIRFLADIGRGVEDHLDQVLPFALEGQQLDGLFLGMGVGGFEVGYELEPYEPMFAQARREGLRVVAHAGETDGPHRVWQALDRFGAERIGHGVRSVDDAGLLAELARRQVPLEVSPTSNYRLGVTPLDQPHPIRTLVDAGVFVTLNSDDPPMFSTDLNHEYVLLAGQGFEWDELWRLNRNTLEASFLPPSEKAELRAEWDAFERSVAEQNA
jgi:adenosine deaminase